MSREIIMKFTIGFLLPAFMFCHSAGADTIQNNWYNRSWGHGIQEEGKPKVHWFLSIQKENLTKDSLCEFGNRKFDPSVAIKSAFNWMKSGGHNSGNFRPYEIAIYTMGKDWKSCVYIVELYNSKEKATMHIGTSLDGKKIYAPVKIK